MGTDSTSDVCFPLDVFSTEAKKKKDFSRIQQSRSWSLSPAFPWWLHSRDSIHGAGPTGCTGSLDDLLHGPNVGHILSTLWEENGLCALVEAKGNCVGAQ